MVNDARIVPLDGRPHVTENIRQWRGDARGHWEGDTLVVESTNFSDKTSFRGSGKNMRLIERFTRVSPEKVRYQYTIDDPESFEKPWTALIPMKKTDQPMYEYACHEGNYSMLTMMEGARADDRAAAEAAKKAASEPAVRRPRAAAKLSWRPQPGLHHGPLVWRPGLKGMTIGPGISLQRDRIGATRGGSMRYSIRGAFAALPAILALIVLAALSSPLAAAADPRAPRTSWGQPDLRGVWDYRTITPLQRSEELADTKVLSNEEAAKLQEQLLTRRNNDRRSSEAAKDVAGAYNDFWLDYGNSLTEDKRTSLIVDPPDGRIPAFTPAGQEREDARKAAMKRPAHGPEDRGPFERCLIGFNAGPPMKPSGYNNNVQISRLRATSDCSSRWSTTRALSRSMGVRICQKTSASGRAIRVAAGRAIRWSSRPGTSRTRIPSRDPGKACI